MGVRREKKRRRRTGIAEVSRRKQQRSELQPTLTCDLRDLVQRSGISDGSFVVSLDCQDYEVSVKKVGNNTLEVISVCSDSETEAAPKSRRRRSMHISRQQLPQPQ